MCGFVGYIGKKAAYPILMKGLKWLKYCRYDSSGMAAMKNISGSIVIGHTHWATFGNSYLDYASPYYFSSGISTFNYNGVTKNGFILNQISQNNDFTSLHRVKYNSLAYFFQFINLLYSFIFVRHHLDGGNAILFSEDCNINGRRACEWKNKENIRTIIQE